MEPAKKNKFIKYLKYAIAAILLVIFATLFALQVFNWNAERKKAEEENRIENAFLLDLKNAETRSIQLT